MKSCLQDFAKLKKSGVRQNRRVNRLAIVIKVRFKLMVGKSQLHSKSYSEAVYFFTAGATLVPSNSMACRILSCGIAPKLIWARKRE